MCDWIECKTCNHIYEEEDFCRECLYCKGCCFCDEDDKPPHKISERELDELIAKSEERKERPNWFGSNYGVRLFDILEESGLQNFYGTAIYEQFLVHLEKSVNFPLMEVWEKFVEDRVEDCLGDDPSP